MVDGLQLQPLRLREEQVYDRHPKGVEDGEDDVCLVSDILDCWWSELNDCVVAYPIGCSTDGGSALTKT